MSGWGGVGEALMNLGGQYMDSYNRKKQYEFEAAEEERKWQLREQIRMNNEMELARVKALYEGEAEEAKRRSPEYRAEQQRLQEAHEREQRESASLIEWRKAQAERARRQPAPKGGNKSSNEAKLPDWLRGAPGFGGEEEDEFNPFDLRNWVKPR